MGEGGKGKKVWKEGKNRRRGEHTETKIHSTKCKAHKEHTEVALVVGKLNT